MQPHRLCSRLQMAAGPVGPARAGLVIAALCALNACRPNVTIGQWTCSEDGGATPVVDASAPVDTPWSTGFENQFCDYTELAGFCYANSGTYSLVTSPVHSGQYAAAFTINSGPGADGQTRCVRQGALPNPAYFGAWYYIPTPVTNTGNWNLFHFTGGTDLSNPMTTQGWLDLSLVNGNGGLQVAVYGEKHAVIDNPANAPLVPIGSWFHLQLYVKRASDATGEIKLYQDGQQIFDATNLMTDDSPLGQWFLGNLASTKALQPPDSILYVDDVTISASL